MKNINLKPMCYKSGKTFSEVHIAYLQSLQEAKSLGIEEDEARVMSILETILEIDGQDNNTSKKITSKYLESGKDFNSFIEELVSSDIPPSSRPEPDIDKPFPDKIEEDDDEEVDDGSYNNDVKTSAKDIDDVIEDDSIDHL